jgi:hypothetical protein
MRKSRFTVQIPLGHRRKSARIAFSECGIRLACFQKQKSSVISDLAIHVLPIRRASPIRGPPHCLGQHSASAKNDAAENFDTPYGAP